MLDQRKPFTIETVPARQSIRPQQFFVLDTQLTVLLYALWYRL